MQLLPIGAGFMRPHALTCAMLAFLPDVSLTTNDTM
jgi:hypothetical protein